MKIRKGHTVVLQNTVDGVRYAIKMISALTAEDVAALSTSTGTTTTSPAATGTSATDTTATSTATDTSEGP